MNVLAALAITAISGGPVRAGAVRQSAEPDANLTKIVHLRSGQCALADLCTELSSQTGVKVVPAAYLSSHVISIDIPDMPAARALQMIAELGGWELASSEKQIIVRRAPVPTPRSLADAPAALRSALPLDYRAFLELDRYDTEDLGHFWDRTNVGQVLMRRDAFLRSLHEKQRDAEHAASTRLAEAVSPAILTDGRVAYRDLAEEKRLLLVQAIMLEALKSFAYGGEWEFLCGDVKPYVSYPEVLELAVRDGLIDVGMSFKNGSGHMGYGAQLSEPQIIRTGQDVAPQPQKKP